MEGVQTFLVQLIIPLKHLQNNCAVTSVSVIVMVIVTRSINKQQLIFTIKRDNKQRQTQTQLHLHYTS